MEPVLVGLEAEYHLIDAAGRLANAAPQLLSALPKEGYAREISQNTVEAITAPHATPQRLAEDLGDKVRRLVDEAQRRDVLPLAASVFSPSEEPAESEGGYYERVRRAMGEENARMGYFLNGTHIHVSRAPDPARLRDQFNVLTALHPLLALSSSSPILLGTHALHNHRIPARRDVVNRRAPELGRLQPYMRSFDEYQAWLSGEVQRKEQRYLEAGVELPDSHDPARSAGHIRIRGPSIEARGPDTTLPSVAVAMTTLYLGVARQLDGMDVRTEGYAGRLRDGTLLRLPTFPHLERLERAAIGKGLADPSLRHYAADWLRLSKRGLDAEERAYLAPLEGMVEYGRTNADRILQLAYESGLRPDKGLSVSGGRLLQRLEAHALLYDLEGLSAPREHAQEHAYRSERAGETSYGSLIPTA